MANILIVEDDQGVRQAMARTLKLAGHRVFEAEDGQFAADLLEMAAHPSRVIPQGETRQDADLIISDNDMPRMTGCELYRHVQDRYPEIPMIILTGGNTREVARQCPRAQIAAKPIGSEDLLGMVEDALCREEES